MRLTPPSRSSQYRCAPERLRRHRRSVPLPRRPPRRLAGRRTVRPAGGAVPRGTGPASPSVRGWGAHPPPRGRLGDRPSARRTSTTPAAQLALAEDPAGPGPHLSPRHPAESGQPAAMGPSAVATRPPLPTGFPAPLRPAARGAAQAHSGLVPGPGSSRDTPGATVQLPGRPGGIGSGRVAVQWRGARPSLQLQGHTTRQLPEHAYPQAAGASDSGAARVLGSAAAGSRSRSGLLVGEAGRDALLGGLVACGGL
jgi:hypothetical protein